MSKYHILSIGISKHQAGTNLQFAHKDASDLFRLFNQNVPNIGSSQLLLDNEATLSNIRTALAAPELKSALPEDAFFFFFSGHGTVAQSDGIAAHFFVPYDATSDFASSCISVDYLKEALSKIPCRAQFIFVDSCFSGALSKGVKFLPGVTKKDLKSLHKLTEVIPGSGKVVFTACKDDEEAIELPDLKHGLFTSCLLSELQKDRVSEQYPILDIFEPVAKEVSAEARKHQHSQTPTFQSHLEGSVYLPTFKEPLEFKPEVIDVPSSAPWKTEVFSPPRILLNDTKKQKVIADSIKFVVDSQQSKIGFVSFSQFCWNLAGELSGSWEETFQKSSGTIADLPKAVAEFEANSFQLLAFGTVVALYGSEEQIEEFAKCVVSVLELTDGRSGFVALIAVPETLVLLMTYFFGIVSLATNNLAPLRLLLEARITRGNDGGDPIPLRELRGIHYCSALGGNADKIGDHVRSFIDNNKWLEQLLPRTKGKLTEYQLQVNYLLSIEAILRKDRLWPDFGRFYQARIRPLIDQLKYDAKLIKQVADFLAVPAPELRKKMHFALQEIGGKGLFGHYFWESISPTSVLTNKEREDLKQLSIPTPTS